MVTHDSDSVPGLANRIIARWAAWHATGLPVELYPYPPTKSTYTGIPISPSYFRAGQPPKELLAKHGLPAKAQVLLVMGGSLGAGSINEKLPEIAGLLLSRFPNLYIFHIAGLGSEARAKPGESLYSDLPAEALKRVKLISFTDQLEDIQRLADVVLTRAGATSLAELAALKIACVVVPSPYLADGHQLKNAEWLKDNKAAVILADDAPADTWLTAVSRLLDSKAEQKKLSASIAKLAKPKAAEQLGKIIIKITTHEINSQK